MTDAAAISPQHPAIPGHFPGHPVVPGVLILAEVRRQCAARHPCVTLTGLKKLKFLRLLKPGEPFRIEFAEPRNGGLRFSCRSGDGDTVIAEGNFSTGD